MPISIKLGRLFATSESILALKTGSSSSTNQLTINLDASGTGVNSYPNLVGYLPDIIEALDGAQVALAA